MSGLLGLPDAYAGAARSSVRVTVAAAGGFYLFLYGFGETVTATYALFAAVSLGGLSRIPGTGRQRAVVMLRVLPVACLLVVVGTFLAVRTASAVAGMLVIGFALAFVAVGGPRPAGAAPGLQLLYILPSFPPYAPDTLGERLIGTTTGILLLVVAEACLFPERPTVPYRELAARAADIAERCAGELARPPYSLSRAAGDAAGTASQSLRPSRVPEADRPAGPGVRSRALAHTGLAARTLLNRLNRLPAAPDGRTPAEPGLELLRAVARSAADSAALLRGVPGAGAANPAPERAAVAAGRDRPADPEALRRDAALLELADAAIALSTAARLAVRGRDTGAVPPLGRFWYAPMRAPQLWWRRLIGNTGSRSVFFQNAVRISLALAAARVVAGLDTLPHGFWAMLATLSLTRTTLDATRTSIRQALTGTLIGALCTAGILALVGTDTTVYAAVLVPLLLITFTVGPVKGIGWAQAFFAIVVSLVFAQLAPATWELAEVRLLDVVIGSAIGAVFGLLAWPRGAHREVRQSSAALLRSAAETVVATASTIAAGGVRDPADPPRHAALRRTLVLAESAYAQFQAEPRVPAVGAGVRPTDWQAVLLTGHHALWGADRLLVPPPEPRGETPGPVSVPPLDPAEAAALTGLGDRVAGRMLLLAARLESPDEAPAAREDPPDAVPDAAPGASPPAGAPGRYYAAETWLDALLADLGRITDADSAGPRGTP
ncbi:FUSC family protein [Streptomyces sp. NPDC014870]|uniref:FUSC family protein n=1 Tax=Streptomyces sp. NPDC014870 TaxID=3364925 RepID=UPI0036F81933